MAIKFGPQIARFKRGKEWAGIVQFILIVVLAFELSLWWCIPLAPIIIGFCWITGWIDERWGFWKEEQAHRWRINPEWIERNGKHKRRDKDV